jgi:hypothetical protein
VVADDDEKAENVLAVQRFTGVRLPMCTSRANPAGCWHVSQRFLDEAVVIRVVGPAPVAYYRVVRTGQWVVRDQATTGPAGIPPAWAR